MSSFLSTLVIRALSPSELKQKGSTVQFYELTQDFSYQCDLLPKTIVVPTGFQTDFASIPRIAWSWMDPEDPVILFASVIHDFLYSTGSCTREQADGVLKEAMAICGASSLDQNIVYRAVRFFGGSHWKAP